MTEETVLDYRVKAIETTLNEIKDSHRSIAESLSKLVVLEQRHEQTARSLERAFGELKELDVRLTKTEEVSATIAALSASVSDMKKILYAGVGIVLIAVFGLVFDAAVEGKRVRALQQQNQEAAP